MSGQSGRWRPPKIFWVAKFSSGRHQIGGEKFGGGWQKKAPPRKILSVTNRLERFEKLILLSIDKFLLITIYIYLKACLISILLICLHLIFVVIWFWFELILNFSAIENIANKWIFVDFSATRQARILKLSPFTCMIFMINLHKY